MSRAKTLAVVGGLLVCASIVAAQGVPAPPKGLRIVTGDDEVFPIPPGSHGYFDSLVVRSDLLAAYSLRDDEQIYQVTMQKRQPRYITYDPRRDPDPRRQDAAKIFIPADKTSVPNQVRMPIPPVPGDSLLVTWDAWFGKEWRMESQGSGTYKQFQFSSNDRIWTEIRSRFDQARATGALAMVDVRSYGQTAAGRLDGPFYRTLGPNVTQSQPLAPQAAQFGLAPETWTRYWVHFRPMGEWYEFSVWVADETRDPVRLFRALQMKPNPNDQSAFWNKFWLEYNTSLDSSRMPAGRGPLVSYARNVVMLRGIIDPTRLLVRPAK